MAEAVAAMPQATTSVVASSYLRWDGLSLGVSTPPAAITTVEAAMASGEPSRCGGDERTPRALRSVDVEGLRRCRNPPVFVVFLKSAGNLRVEDAAATYARAMRTAVTRCFTFEAAHYLPLHEGQCRELHGHRYQLEVTVEGPVNDDGMVIDFGQLAEIVKTSILNIYDHSLLNDVLQNPTTELLIEDTWKRLESSGLAVSKIKLWETASNFAELTR